MQVDTVVLGMPGNISNVDIRHKGLYKHYISTLGSAHICQQYLFYSILIVGLEADLINLILCVWVWLDGLVDPFNYVYLKT